MRFFMLFAFILSVLVLMANGQKEDAKGELLGKVCKKCEGCKDINVIGEDEDGPIFDCEPKCSACETSACTSGGTKPAECRNCRKGETVAQCTERCRRGCRFCSKTKACN